MNIRDEIVKKREQQAEKVGFTMGETIPESREVPLIPFGRSPFLVCEIKRSSPSKGDIDKSIDAVELAGTYKKAGIKSVSVLTESQYFSGSITDIMKVKKAYPKLSVLRKDFLFDEQDIDISWRAGADAILLIAGILEKDRFWHLYNKAESYGLDVLVEVHSEEDIEKIKNREPYFVGINSRDLSSFSIDKAIPLRLKSKITWDANLVYESGINHPEDISIAAANGFIGYLVGEAVVRNPELIGELLHATQHYIAGKFWQRLYSSKQKNRPLVKICGFTREEDIRLAEELGADVLGFVLAESKRKVSTDFIKSITARTRSCPAVGVVVKSDKEPLEEDIKELIEAGMLDALQYHGTESSEYCWQQGVPYYKALRAKDEQVVDKMREYRSPRVLLDGYSPNAAGGTGVQVDEKVVEIASKVQKLWIAGGITPENVGEYIRRYNPELIDISSGIEDEPGVKSEEKMRKLFKEIANASGE